ncbi:MAG: hypothetical protein K0R18_3028 [Bacillales bacterium]|jgi:hypothetical protein|nr:hypothetical protein [Bacillales bacterium]
MALSRVERIKQEREQLFQEMEGKKKKSSKEKMKIIAAIITILLVGVVVFFGIKQFMNKDADSKKDANSVRESEKPQIMFDPYIEITVGDSFDFNSDVDFSDNKDSKSFLKESLKISSTPEFDANTEGSYSLEYAITDSDKNSVSKTRIIVVNPAVKTDAPSISVANEAVEIEVGTTYDLKEGLSIINGDQSLLEQIKVSSTPTFNKDKEGEYNINFSVEDAAGNKLEAFKKVTVKPKGSITKTNNTPVNTGTSTKTDTEKPMLIMDTSSQTIAVGTKIDLTKVVTKTTDNVDANHVVLATLKITSNPEFNYNKAGVYKITYSVQDKAGNVRKKDKTITVK